ncbi:ATP-grasp domain-containing protein [Gammaproteobacteria bacterium]|nr:ATP-grasp domain-containing protein [Gammaproteobacteria bacterium]
MKILVSGIGGDIGFGAGRILKKMPSVHHIFGIDIHGDHPGISLFDQCDIAPASNDASYLAWLHDYIDRNEIDIFVPTSEPEITFFCQKNIQKISKAHVLISNIEMVKLCLNKYKCLKFLRSSGIKVPAHGMVGQEIPSHFPIITKPNKGAGSVGINKIISADEYNAFNTPGSNNITWQEYLFPDDQEYTCALFQAEGVELKTLIIKRELSHGFTSKGEIVEDDLIENYIRKVATVLKLDGVINIQLRLTSEGPMLFEINPRLSSTLMFRDLLGFSDLQWWIFSTMGQKISSYKKPMKGTLFYRGITEYIV